MAGKKKKQHSDTIALNKRARFDYELGEKFEVLAHNRFDTQDEFSSTPAISDGDLFIRGNRTLLCVAKID